MLTRIIALVRVRVRSRRASIEESEWLIVERLDGGFQPAIHVAGGERSEGICMSACSHQARPNTRVSATCGDICGDTCGDNINVEITYS